MENWKKKLLKGGFESAVALISDPFKNQNKPYGSSSNEGAKSRKTSDFLVVENQRESKEEMV